MGGLRRMPPNGESLVVEGGEKHGFLWLGARQAKPYGALRMRDSCDAPMVIRESHESESLATAVSLWHVVSAIALLKDGACGCPL